jgi:hypothetical protein
MKITLLTIVFIFTFIFGISSTTPTPLLHNQAMPPPISLYEAEVLTPK